MRRGFEKVNRAIGNGMAQPCADYVMSKVVKDIKEET